MNNIVDKIHVLDDIVPIEYQNYIINFLTTHPIWSANGFLENTTYLNNEEMYEFFDDPNKISQNTYEDIQLVLNGMLEGDIKNPHFYNLLQPLYFIQSYFGYSFEFIPHRIKANLQTRTTQKQPNKHNTPHTDIAQYASNFLTIIYYVVDSDGDTIIFNEKDMPGEKISNLTIKQTVSPKQGRVIIFPTNTFHTGNHPSNFPGRIVMNYNIEIRPT